MTNPAPDAGPFGSGLDYESFVSAFPFFVAWDRDFKIVDFGPSLVKICGDVRTGRLFTDVFQLERPFPTMNLEQLNEHHGSLFLFRHVASGRIFRAQLIFTESEARCGVFLASPWFTTPEEVTREGLTASDFAAHDPVFDLLQLVQNQRAAVTELKTLAESLRAKGAELRDANKKLLEQEQESRKLALIAARTDNAVILTDATGQVEWVNAAFTRITGYSLEEVSGGIPGLLRQGPKTDPATVDSILRHLRAGDGINTAILNHRKDGSTYWLSLEIQPMRDSNGKLSNFMAIQRDITRKRAEELRQRIQHASSRILASPGSIKEAGARILKAISEHLGGTIGQLWMRNPGEDFMHCGVAWHDPTIDLSAFLELSQTTKASLGQYLPGLVWQERKLLWFEDLGLYQKCLRSSAAAACGLHGALAFPILSNNEILGVLEFCGPSMDEPDEPMQQVLSGIGNQMGEFVARRRAEKSMLEAKELAERANEAKSLFLATMSHEIRTPINGILGFTGLLANTPLTQTQREYLQTIRNSGDILLHIINDVLDFSRIESGTIEIENIDYQPAVMLDETMELHRHQAQSKGLSLTWAVDPSVPDFVVGDVARIRQVLINLVANAIKFTEAGSVSTRLWAADDDLHFEIRDTGIGFPQEQLEQLFKPFHQGDASTTRRFGGTGLGLAICQRLLDLMCGGIGAESSKGNGSTFRFHVPLISSAKNLTDAAPSTLSANGESPDGAGRTVLLAEDNMINAQLLTILLENMGIQVELARNGVEAIERLTHHPDYSAIFMDVRMPEMDGTEATRRIRSGEAGETGRTIPVIALTASVLPSDQKECMEAGMDHYLSKPVMPDDLIATLRATGVIH